MWLRDAGAAGVAIALPTLVAFNVPPSATFLNQAVAFIGWGVWLMLLASALPADAWRPRGHAVLLLAALAVLLVAALASPAWSALPPSLALSAAGMIVSAALVALVGAACATHGLSESAFRSFCIALMVAGLASSVVGMLQVYAPGWTDGDWIARPALQGRASGNLRQPNHLSSLLLWSIVAVAWLGERTPLRRAMAYIAGALMVFVVVLTGSRTGALGMLLLAAWGGLDRTLSRPTRRALLLAPVAFAVFWLAVTGVAHLTHQVFGGEARFLGKEGDISASRFAIWSNTLALIAAHPLFGVGFGDFNFAWTLTPFPDRPIAFFDHTHNLLLQFAVELGLPLALLVCALLLGALWAAFRRAREAGDAAGRAASAGAPPERAAFVIVLMAALHSQLEYPLWYAYFLLPTAFAWGLCLAGPARASDAAPAPAVPTRDAPERRTRPLLLAAMLLVLGGAVAIWDYSRVVVIFAPPVDAGPLDERIEAGRHSWFFAPHADYAAATTAEHPSSAMASFKVATHYLLDTRLMMAWARALAESGDEQRARYVAQRLREFRNEASASFFAPCTDAALPQAQKPFQCKAPTRAFTYRDFR